MFGGLEFRTFLDRWAATAGRYEGATAEKAVAFPSAARRSFALVRSACFNRRYWCLGGDSWTRSLDQTG